MGKNTIPAIILAAGASERLGQPKALLEVEGQSLLSIISQRLASQSCHPIIIVTRAELALSCLSVAPECNVVINNRPEDGRTGSVQDGLLAIGEENGRLSESALIVPIDRPGWSVSTLQKILSAESCACPSQDGRGAHPLLIGKDEIIAIMSATRNRPLHELVNPSRIQVEDMFLHINIDTPEDIAELARWAASSDGLSR